MSRTAIALVTLAASVGSAFAQTRPLSLQDYYRVETVNGTAISPDGRTVVFVRTSVAEAENRRNSEIWEVPADGSFVPARRLTDPAFSSTAPRFSPDGRLLAFNARRRVVKPGEAAADSPGESVWFLRMDNSSAEPFRIPGVGGVPIFSPDNKWIAFTKPVKPTEPPRASSPSDAEKLIDERFKGRKYDWMNARFDGRGYLADPRDPLATPPEEIFIVAREGGEARQLTTLGVNARGLAWRPDSGALAFVADTHQRDEYSYDRADLFTVSLTGSLTRLTDDGYDHASPAWNAAGDAIVALRERSLNQVLAAKQTAGAPSDLFWFSLAGGGTPRNLTAGWDFIPGAPHTSADGRFAYFSAGRAGTTHLYRVPLSGGDVEQVTTGDRRLADIAIAWAAGRMAFGASGVTSPGEAFTARLDGSDERRLTAVNQALARDVSLRPAERLQFSSKDGTPVEGWLLMPAVPSGTRVPLILSIHGGPHGAYGTEFSFYLQWMAANGYAVLYTNPRGSTEYGEKFLWATWGGWGGLDYDDVMAGVDHVVARYPIDPKRLGVTGYSYGGFLTNWVITQTPRFAAAIVGAGISNWISDYGTADIPRTKESEFYGTPWEARGAETLLKWSPVMKAGSVVTPRSSSTASRTCACRSSRGSRCTRR